MAAADRRPVVRAASISISCPPDSAAANLPQQRAAANWERQADGQTDARHLH